MRNLGKRNRWKLKGRKRVRKNIFGRYSLFTKDGMSRPAKEFDREFMHQCNGKPFARYDISAVRNKKIKLFGLEEPKKVLPMRDLHSGADSGCNLV
jgi:hypothetical protein